MSKIYPGIAIIALLFNASIACAQEKEIDFLNRKPTDLKGEFKIDSKVKVKVTNINRFLYKVTSAKPKRISMLLFPRYYQESNYLDF